MFWTLARLISPLGTERERIVKILHHNDLVVDVFAGVGPFAVPASMLGCTVYANDINPESVKWMTLNLESNRSKKSSKDYHVFNLDGREFLRTIAFARIEAHQRAVQNDADQRWCQSDNKIVILMNLPDIALTFLDVFPSWLSTLGDEKDQWPLPVQIHCYTFSKADDQEDDIRSQLKTILPQVDDANIAVRFVRHVAPKKDMMCAQITLFGNRTTPTDSIEHDDDDERAAKRFKPDSSD